MEYILSIENKCKFCSWIVAHSKPFIVRADDQKIYAFCPECKFELDISTQETEEEHKK